MHTNKDTNVTRLKQFFKLLRNQIPTTDFPNNAGEILRSTRGPRYEETLKQFAFNFIC